ncbi:M14 family metallopeptidase [Pareuzebyella sediminis]|uniref:M14 family metallopeptidase n=1 Tax=Pareuzebyella sediminis TaxID=2607998 RepID=UPI0011ECEF90|nr:M14 family metallopeptidase [Pareuzebyella sediminis]
MRTIAWFLILAFLKTTAAQEKVDLEYYLPSDISYTTSIPTPKEILGHEVGEWHVTHDKLIYYMQQLANSSDRISIENRGETFEGRPLLLLTITSPKNHENIDRIQKEHLALTEGNGSSISVDDKPIVVYQGFSIHGNEPSGSNAALLYAYYLAAAEGERIDELLDNVIILLDPSFNPDGLQRFAYWANTNKSINLNPDNNEREYHEIWPSGRTNHYWFDLNRDWLPVQLPESRARIASFYQWMPNILTDHHEMGTNSTFFFQPGEPTRVHPLTPLENQTLTREIGAYHAKALNKIGSLYYSEENYDDYYYGKGSTFPDVTGGIGILFEQASSRGHVQYSDNGLLTFPFTIRNQLTTALSTIRAALELRIKILAYQQKFYKNIRIESAIGRTKAFVFGNTKDAARTWHLAEILKRHKVKVHELSQDTQLNGNPYKKGYSYVVPLNQKNDRLIKAMFEKRTTFSDSIFYDISAWTFPLAFNLDYTELRALDYAGTEIDELSFPSGNVDAKSNYAYLFEWNEYYTPKALNKILNHGIRAKVAKAPFGLGNHQYGYGTIMIPVKNQNLSSDQLYRFLQGIAKESALQIRAANGSYAKGIDLGSNDFDTVKKQKVALLVGDGIRSYDAGEIWHLFDTRYAMELTKIDLDYINTADLSSYTDIIVPSASAKVFTKSMSNKLKQWVRAGGTLIGYRNTVALLEKNGFMALEFKTDTLRAKHISFAEKSDFKGAQEIGGAIIEAHIDLSHPINYGYDNVTLPLFRNTTTFIKPDKNSYNNPIQYTSTPLMSGYISEENLELLKNSVPFQAQRMGKGWVMGFTDNTNFRAFWYGTNKLLMNAIFFGGMM